MCFVKRALIILHFFRIRIDQFELINEGAVIQQPAVIPYHLQTSVYANGVQGSDVSLRFSFYLCPHELQFSAAPSTMSVDAFSNFMDRSICFKLPVSLTASQLAAIGSTVVSQHTTIDLSDTESGLNIPFNGKTYQYCWKSVSIYVLVYSTLTKPQQVRKWCEDICVLLF